MTLDEKDTRILRHLTKDGRASFRQIARDMGVSAGTVMARVRNMEREGVIKGYSCVLDHEKLGYQLTAVTEITVSKGKLLEMEEAISRLDNVCAVYDVTGLTDAVVVAKFRSREELNTYTKRLLSMPFVERTNTHLVLTTVKEDFQLI